jgi:hypothetical protein
MTAPAILYLALEGLVFAIWAVVAFRTLFQLRARAVARTGRFVPQMSAQLLEFRRFLHAAEDRTARRSLAILTIVLLGLAALAPVFLGA